MLSVHKPLASASPVYPGQRVLPMLALLMIMFEPAAPAQTSDAAFYVATYVDVQLSSTNQGIALAYVYRGASRTESGNSGVEVVQEAGRPNRCGIREVWKEQSDLDAHEGRERRSQV